MKQSCYLIGARGVGKTFIGRLLARCLGYDFLDTDELVQQRVDMTIAKLVEQQGWPAFRAIERDVLSACSRLDRVVVATGGGAVLHGEIWSQIKQRAWVIWLTAPIDTVLQRIDADPGSASLRPSLTGGNQRQEYEAVLQEREPLYRGIADQTIAAGSLDSDRIVADIMKIVQFSQECKRGTHR
ncbi:MAG: shikimate kinase AroL [Desulfofustis sp.]|nr:shikimate kinase AroL [Desulfofustis sp.]